MIRIYGTKDSRAFRCLWALEEAGLDYELVPIDFRTADTKTPEFLKLNPNGRVPVFEQDGFILVESLAINLHIASLVDTSLAPAAGFETSLAIQWTVWAMGELEGPHDAANRDNSDVDDELRTRTMKVLDNHLSRTSYLVSDHFTVADLNVASILMRPKYTPHLSRFDRVQDWFGRCASRPALAKALGRNNSDLSAIVIADTITR